MTGDFPSQRTPEEISRRLGELAAADAARMEQAQLDHEERMRILAEALGGVLPLTGLYIEMSFHDVPGVYRPEGDRTGVLPADRYLVGPLSGADTSEPIVLLTPALNPTDITYGALADTLTDVTDADIVAHGGSVHPFRPSDELPPAN